MTRAFKAALLALAITVATDTGGAQARAPTPIRAPSQLLGISVGADRVLADWTQITRYFSALAVASPRMRLDTLGLTTLGKPFIVATISSAENIKRLPEIRAAQARLADPRGLSAADERRIVDGQPAVIFISCNLHSSEIGSSQMAMELAYRLVTVPSLRQLLRNTVVLLAPSMNPDGEQMITDWYRSELGTPFEGGAMPWIYHQYAGHDNNRDWFMVTQQETRMVTDLLYRRWFPTVFYDVHQQGSTGMRLSLPPHVDPINPNVDPLIVRGINLIGMQMQYALEGAGKTGVGDGVTYDLWWHGGARSTPTRHNMVGLLTEAASVKIATPITQKRDELTGHPRGLTTYEQKVNFPNPWPGGTWRLRDIMDYELIAAEALVELTSTQRRSFVRNFVNLGRKAIRAGESESPRAWVIPSGQRDPSAVQRLVEVLRLGAVEVSRANADFTVSGKRYSSGSYIVNMAQPYRAHAKDLLEVQRFPRMEKYPGGPVEPPYDVAGWTLPFQFGVRADAVAELPGVATTPITDMRDNAIDCGDALPGTGFIALDPRDTRSFALVSRALNAGVPARVTAAPMRTVEGATLPTGSWILERMPPTAAVKGDRGCGGPLHTVATLPDGSRLTRAPRVALYKPWTAAIDEGWTRWVLEQFGIGFTSLTDSMTRAGSLRPRYDAIVVPDMTLRQMRDGMSPSTVRAPYAGGLGDEGVAALRTFVQQGGRLVLLDHAAQFAVQELGVKIGIISGRSDEDVGARVGASNAEQLYAPGSVLRTLVDTTQSLAIGAADTVGVYFTNSVTFDVADPAATVVARYPGRGSDILMSGYLQGASQIAGKATLVKVNVGQGSVVMFGFRPQHRGQAYGTFRLLFNAILRL